jgi:predicted outer membrane protein
MLNIHSCGRLFGLAAALALAGVTAPAFAADGPTDPQIAHIAYTAGAIDVKAAQRALQISKDALCALSPTIWCATIRP